MTRIIVTTLMGVVASLRIEAKGKATFKELVEEFKHQMPQKHRSFDRESREWRITITGLAYLETWISQVRINRPDVEVVRDGQKYARILSPSSADEVTAAYWKLHLLNTAPEPVVLAAHKALSILYHPDKQGGDLELQQEINAARDLILRRLQERAA